MRMGRRGGEVHVVASTEREELFMIWEQRSISLDSFNSEIKESP